MIIANIIEMLNNKINVEYKCYGHRWINEHLSCGCIVAICLDIEPTEEDTHFVVCQFNKISALKTLIQETFYSDNETVSGQRDRFINELKETQRSLSDFIIKKRNEYKFPVSTDFNFKYYLLKLKQGEFCKS